MHDGLDAILYRQNGCGAEIVSARAALPEEIGKARQGWEMIANAPADQYFDILRDRIEKGTPSTRLAEERARLANSGLDRQQSLQQAVRELGYLR